MKSLKISLYLLFLSSVLLIGLSIVDCSSDENKNVTGGGGGSTTGLFDGVPSPSGASFMSEVDCREGGKKKDYQMSGGDSFDIASDYKSVLDNNGWNTFNLGGISLGAGFQATKDGRYLNFQVGGPPSGLRFINLCVWPSQPNDDNCDQDCTD